MTAIFLEEAGKPAGCQLNVETLLISCCSVEAPAPIMREPYRLVKTENLSIPLFCTHLQCMIVYESLVILLHGLKA